MPNNPSIIARPTPTGFEGRYVNHDGGPLTRLPLLRDLYLNGFHSDLGAMTTFLVVAHPAGWSQLGADPTVDTSWTKYGPRPGNNDFMCYCHGERNEPPQLITEQDDTHSLADWIYVLHPEGIEVISEAPDGSWQPGQLTPWTHYPSLARSSDPHRTATALTIIGIQNTEDARNAGLELIESLTEDELRELAAAFATQAASHCVRSFGGSQDKALNALQKVAAKLAALPHVD